MSHTHQDLDVAQSHVNEGARRVAHQRYLLEQLQKAGHDTSSARELLEILERAQAELVAHRDRVAQRLGRPHRD